MEKNFFSKIYNVFEVKQKKTFLLLSFLMLIATLLETFGIGLIIPIVMTIFENNFFLKHEFLKNIYYFFNQPSQKQIIIYTCSLLVIFYFLKNLFMYFFFVIEGEYIYKTQKNIITKLYDFYISQNHYNIFKLNSSRLMSNIITDTSIFVTTTKNLLIFLSEVMIAIGILSLLFILNPTMFVFNFIITALGMALIGVVTRKKILKMGYESKRLRDDFFIKLNNSFDSVKEINVYQKNFFFSKMFDNNNQDIFQINKKLHVFQGLPKITYEILGVTLLALIIIYFTVTSVGEAQTITFLAIAGASAFRLIPCANRIINSLQYFSYARKSVNLISSEIAQARKLDLEKKIKNFHNFSKTYPIIIDNISYKYPDREEYIFKNTSLEIKKNEKILLFGETGSGKSTLIELILGLLKPCAGKIQVENQNLYENFNTWSEKIGYVPQKISLIEGTILSNLAFGQNEKEIDYKLLEKSLEVSELKKFLNDLPDGMQTEISPGGSNLSGGQRQRVGIARALYRNPQILIFDESTNAIDEDLQQKIIKNILNVSNEKIILFISHDRNLEKFFDYSLKISKAGIKKIV